MGIVNEKCDPRPFMEALQQLTLEHPEFAANVKLEFIGEVHPQFRKFVNDSSILNDLTTFAGNVPHKQVIKLYGSSSLLLLVLTGYKDAEGYMPGKLFEYLATGTPVLAIGPVEGDAAALLKETRAGEMIGEADTSAIKELLVKNFYAWKSHGSAATKKNTASQYSRKEITGKLVTFLSG